LNITEAEGSREQDLPECKKSAGRSCHDVLVEGAWIVPVCEAKSFVVRSASQIDDESADDEADDQHDLEGGEDDFGLCRTLVCASLPGMLDGKQIFRLLLQTT
jgi:hypothetical protein